jgi:pantoate--beta-alanine ligase
VVVTAPVIERVGSKEEVHQAVAEAKREGKTIGFVPTMGALHEGHLSLIRTACRRTGFVVVSVFVNPTQFGPGEDFAAYPRDVDRDLELMSAEGVDLIFTPSVEEMYGTSAGTESTGPAASAGAARSSDAEDHTEDDAVDRFEDDARSGVTVDPGVLARRWEGEIRPHHFRGVATVVAKLLNIVGPDLAFFGEKDYQQLVVVKRMVRDLDVAASIVGCPIVRDCDGLALSSRNAYLTSAERCLALSLPRALDAAAEALAWGEVSGPGLNTIMREVVEHEAGVMLDYAAVVDPETLEPLETVTDSARAIIAARVGRTRLIDNAELKVPSRRGST